MRALSRRGTLPIAVAIVIGCIIGYVAYSQLFKQSQGWRLKLRLDGKDVAVYTLDELEALAENVTIEGKAYHAVPLTKLLADAGVSANKVRSFVAVGADGYKREIDAKYLGRAYVWIVPKEERARQGPLRLVVEGLSHKWWVKYLVEIELRS